MSRWIALYIPRIRGGEPNCMSDRFILFRYSPHTRGWTRYSIGENVFQTIFPAYAGVNPVSSYNFVFLWHIPRIRGGEPTRCESKKFKSWYSPHTRGWTWYYGSTVCDWWIFPAYAGVNLLGLHRLRKPWNIPRIRGGEPMMIFPDFLFLKYSPHTRGWTCKNLTRDDLLCIFPAYAGVNLLKCWLPTRLLNIPRIRGGEP